LLLVRLKSQFSPTASDWSNYAEWKNAGSQDILVRANKMFKDRLAAAPESMLDSAVLSELKTYMEKC